MQEKQIYISEKTVTFPARSAQTPLKWKGLFDMKSDQPQLALLCWSIMVRSHQPKNCSMSIVNSLVIYKAELMEKISVETT